MPNIDIPVPKDLQDLMAAPKCFELRPPPPKTMKIQLPTGGSLTALHDMGKAVPTDCSLSFSLMLQIMPLMASMECLLKVLKLLKPLSDAVTSPPPTPALIKEIAESVADLAPCFLAITPAGMIPFVRDILCLLLALLRCLIGQLKSLSEIIGGLTIQLRAAEESGNTDLVRTLKCAQENSLTSMQHLMNGFGPVGVILDMMAPMMSIAGVSAIKLPALGDTSSTEGLNDVLATLQTVVDTIQFAVDALGGVFVMADASFLGRGWRFPIQPDAGGGLGYVEGAANIEQSLRVLLMTALGERVMRPTFGCDAVRLVFAPGSVQYLRLLETSVREAVRDWEPRVQLEDVAAETIPGDETRVNVSINYRVRGSNTRNNLVFPFYLGQVEVNT